MLESIKKRYENIGNIHILSTDPDWENVCKVNKYICHKTFSSLSDYLNRQYEVAEKIHQFLNEQTTQSYIESNVLKMIQNLSFDIDGKEIDKKGYVHGYILIKLSLILLGIRPICILLMIITLRLSYLPGHAIK